MSALESLIATGGEAPMIDSLDFTLPPASTSIVDRRQHCRAYPTSASTLNPATGTRQVRLRLGGDDFVDASSVRLMYTITEKAGVQNSYLAPNCGPWGMWSQVYLRSNGVELDNLPQYGRYHQQFGWNHLSQAQQYTEGICGFGGSEVAATATNQSQMGRIAAGTSYTVLHPLHLSLFSSGKLLPVRYAPLEVELTLGDPADWLNAGTNMSQSYDVTNIQLLFSSYILDESVLESFYKALLSNRVLSIPTMSTYMVSHTVPVNSSTYTFTTVRAFSRLSHVWISFRKTGSKSSSFICPLTITDNEGAVPVLSDQAPRVRLSVGPKNWPDGQPNASIPELWYQYQQCLTGVPNMTRDDYLKRMFCIGFDLRRQPNDPTSAISTRSGDLLRVELTNLTPDTAQYEVYVVLHAFSVTAVRESGVTLLT